jgi:hypothetical protein
MNNEPAAIPYNMTIRFTGVGIPVKGAIKRVSQKFSLKIFTPKSPRRDLLNIR